LSIPKFGKVQGVKGVPQELSSVYKLGNATGFTEGRLVSARVDHLEFSFGNMPAIFDKSFEIEGANDLPFSWMGDSGSVILDDAGFAFGLLYGGADHVLSSGKTVKVTYANDLLKVFSRLNLPLDISDL
jgi:hypothetical protein